MLLLVVAALGLIMPISAVAFLDKVELQLFVCGSLLGLLWEAPLSAPGCMQDPSKLLRLLRPLGVLQLCVWCAWDGGICMAGHWLASALDLSAATSPGLAYAVHLGWGQVSSLAVEIIACVAGLWDYKPSKYNPSIVCLPNKKHITVLPQAIWFAASSVFFLFVVYLEA